MHENSVDKVEISDYNQVNVEILKYSTKEKQTCPNRKF